MNRIFEEFKLPAIQTKIVQHFGGFFHQTKLCLRIGEMIIYKPRLPKNKEIRSIFVFSVSEL